MTIPAYQTQAAAVHPNADVAEWLRKAVADMQTAERELAVVPLTNLDAVVFHPQQSAEKLLKAALVTQGQKPPKVHDLVHLHTLLQRSILTWQFPVNELSDLSSGAVEARYPGTSTTRAQADQAMATASHLWVRLRPLI